MPMDLQHRIKFIIRFDLPVDLYDVIYMLKIKTRTDFIADTKQIILIDKIPSDSDSDLASDSDLVKDQTTDQITNPKPEFNFFQTYSKVWNSHLNYFSFKNISELDPADLEERFRSNYEMINMRNQRSTYSDTDSNHIPTDTFENYFEYWKTLFARLDEFFKSKTLDPESKKVLDAIMETPELKDNIKSIGWEDYWLSC